MIAFISGRVVTQDTSSVILQTNSGIGYEVRYNQLLAKGHDVSLFISHVIREDSQVLYGFLTTEDRDLFHLLMSVNGIGPKTAYGIISTLGADELRQAVIFEDEKKIKSAPGVGAKGAAQIILSLKDKLTKMGHSVGVPVNGKETNRQLDDVLMACRELGFKEDKVIPVLKKLSIDGLNSEQILRQVLQELR